MYLKSITGEVIFEGCFHTVKRAVEAALYEKICLDYVDLRNANLMGAQLDQGSFNYANFWGANLTSANMAGVQMGYADCRNVNFKDACLGESVCQNTDFRGSFFSQTILRGADLTKTKFSCPSLFRQNLFEAHSLQNAIYTHKGEIDCDISNPPIIISGLAKDIVLLAGKIIIGSSLYDIDFYEGVIKNFSKVISTEKIFLKELVH